MNVDSGITRLVNALDSIDGLYTISSCAGHKEPEDGQKSWGEFYVDFRVSHDEHGWRALEHVTCCIDEWWEVSDTKISLNTWIDGHLRWDLKGEYTDQKEIDEFAGLVEEMIIK